MTDTFDGDATAEPGQPAEGRPEPPTETEIREAAEESARRPDPRQPAYDAVIAYIGQLGDRMPPGIAHRNAIIWRAVHAALDATHVGRCVASHCVEDDHIVDPDERPVCVHPDGYRGECPCPPRCTCCRVVAAPRQADAAGPHARLESAARRALDALADLILDSPDPGVEALGAQYELRHALTQLAPPKPDEREWTVETRWNDGTWRTYSRGLNTPQDALEQYAGIAAGPNRKYRLRLVCATTTYTVEAEHVPEEEA